MRLFVLRQPLATWLKTEDMKNAICQRVGCIDSGLKIHGQPICRTCRKPFDDEDPPALYLSTIDVPPDGPGALTKRLPERPQPKPQPVRITVENVPAESRDLANRLIMYFALRTGHEVEFLID